MKETLTKLIIMSFYFFLNPIIIDLTKKGANTCRLGRALNQIKLF